jgi:thymidylate kinase
MNSGAFIVLEGGDSAYVQAQFDLLYKRLVKAGHDVYALKFPQLSQTSSYFVAQYQNGSFGDEQAISPYTASLFYAMDHYESASKIRDTLTTGGVVLATGFHAGAMAKQANKLQGEAERRGFYLWHDGLEFDMLGLPRPDKTYILKTGAHIPESPLSAEALYDAICHLFPKDMQMIDLLRNQTLIDDDKANDLLWAAIEPLLPFRDDKPEVDETATEPAPVPIPPAQTITVSELFRSNLEAEGLSDTRLVASDLLERDGTYQYYVPAGLSDELRTTYVNGLNEIFGHYADMLSGLSGFLQDNLSAHKVTAAQAGQAARRILRPILPLAVQSMISLTDRPKAVALQHLAVKLPHETADIVKILGIALGAEKLEDSLNELAGSVLTGTYTEPSHSVQLTSVTPRNELDLAASILYEYSDLSLKEIEASLGDVSYDQKATLLEAYLGSSKTEALGHIHYTWELLCDFGVYRELQQLDSSDMSLRSQPVTPRYGYRVTKLLEDAGLDELFDDCFDVSLRLHSQLHATGLYEAQYACLNGHKMRITLTHTGASITRLAESRSRSAYPGYNELIDLILERISELHPLIGQNLVNMLPNAY